MTPLKKLIDEEVRGMLKEYFHTTNDNRQTEVQEFLSVHLDRETLREFGRNPRAGRLFVRENFNEHFYWWASEDIENLFRNWR